jgi:hypothetical protein
MNVRSLDSLQMTTWEQDRPTYRADLWTQKRAPPGHQQERIGWKLDAYELTDVDDVRKAIEWLESKEREAGKQDGVNATASTLYALVPQRATGPGLIQLYGVNPTRGET